MKSLLGILLLSCIILIPSWLHAEEPNAGFVQGLWYSSDTVFAETPTRVYVALRNNTPHDLTGTVRFADNGNRIGSSEVRALSGRLVEAWVDWTPSYGAHTITATISNAELHIIGGATKSIDTSGIFAEDLLDVDNDTDGDGIGNKTDLDDDNDETSDIDEKTRGSNPLIPNPKETSTEKATQENTEVKNRNSDTIASKSSATERGLEKYIGEGTANSLLSNVTEKVEHAKQSLDKYRTERNDEIYKDKTTTMTRVVPEGLSADNATITRSQIETKDNLLNSFISGISSLLKNIYTFILWISSRALSYPALIQFILLIGILYTIYRIARSIGRRPRN